MAKSKKFWALLLTLVMVAALFPASALAIGGDSSSKWTIPLSKTASDLSGDKTTVTLSVPGECVFSGIRPRFASDPARCRMTSGRQ